MRRRCSSPAGTAACSARLLLDNGHVDAAVRGAVAGQRRGCRSGEQDGIRRCIACQEGHVDAARLLLDNGAEVDRAAEDGTTPLFIACYKGHVDVARLLLDKGAESIGR